MSRRIAPGRDASGGARAAADGGRARRALSTLVLVPWSVMGACSALLMIDQVPILLVYVTFGLGVVLFVVPTLWLYATAALAGLVPWIARLPWWLAATISAAAMAGVAVLPGALSAAVARADTARLTRADRDDPPGGAPRALRLVHDVARVLPDRARSQATCAAACQALLLAEEVDAIEVVALGRDGGRASVVWRREARAACPSVFDERDEVAPTTRRALAAGVCLVAEDGATLGDAPWLRLTAWDRRDAEAVTSWATLHRVRGVRVLTAGGAADPVDAPAVRRTEITAEVLRSPTAIVPASWARKLTMGPWRAERVTNPTSWEDALRAVFGYALAPDREPERADLALVGRLLDRPGDEALGPALEELVAEALKARQRDRTPLDEAELDVVLRLAADPRVRDAYAAAELLARDPAQLRRAVPALVARVVQPVDERHGHTHARFARALAQRPLDELRPHADALYAAVLADGEWSTAPLVGVLPRLVDDAGPLLAQGLASGRDSLQGHAVRGVCNASPEVAAPLLDRVEAVAAGGAGELRAVAILALRRHGREEAAEGLLQGLEERDRRRVSALLAQEASADPPGCRP